MAVAASCTEMFLSEALSRWQFAPEVQLCCWAVWGCAGAAAAGGSEPAALGGSVPAAVSVPHSNSLLPIQPRVCGLDTDLGSDTCKTRRGRLSGALQMVRRIFLKPGVSHRLGRAGGLILGACVTCLD